MKVIGRIETVNLIDFGFEGLDAKVDSGAYTSALHAQKIKKVMIDGKKHVSFHLLDSSHPFYEDRELTAPIFSLKRVKSSNGFMQKRYSIKTRIKIGRKIYKVEFTLTDRKDMRYPILLGTKFLRKKFLVDVSKKNLITKK